MNRSSYSIHRFLKVVVFVFAAAAVVLEAPLPSLRVSKRKQIDEAAQFVCSQILLTRQKAVASGTRYRIQYDYATGACTTLREVAPGEWLPEGGDEGRMPRRVVMSPTSTPPNGHIDIGANGAIENHGVPVVIRLADDKGVQRSIRISPAGMVQEIPAW